MSSTGRNLFKLVGGTAIGAGIAALISRVVESDGEQPEPAVAEPTLSPAQAPGPSTVDRLKSLPERTKERWERAKEAGVAAQMEEEARLREDYRDYVNDPMALPEAESETRSS